MDDLYYFPIHFCIECNLRIRKYDRMHNGGMCPHCGHNSGSTICKTVTKKAHYDIDRNCGFWKSLFGFNKKLVIEEI